MRCYLKHVRCMSLEFWFCSLRIRDTPYFRIRREVPGLLLCHHWIQRLCPRHCQFLAVILLGLDLEYSDAVCSLSLVTNVCLVLCLKSTNIHSTALCAQLGIHGDTNSVRVTGRSRRAMMIEFEITGKLVKKETEWMSHLMQDVRHPDDSYRL